MFKNLEKSEKTTYRLILIEKDAQHSRFDDDVLFANNQNLISSLSDKMQINTCNLVNSYGFNFNQIRF